MEQDLAKLGRPARQVQSRTPARSSYQGRRGPGEETVGFRPRGSFGLSASCNKILRDLLNQARATIYRNSWRSVEILARELSQFQNLAKSLLNRFHLLHGKHADRRLQTFLRDRPNLIDDSH